MSLIFLLTILLLFISGLVVELFISPRGFLASAVAFVAFAVAAILKGGIGGLVPDQQLGMSLGRLKQWRRYVHTALPILGLLFVVALVIVFSQRGVSATDNLPVLARRQRYLLVSHGNYYEVSALRYYIAAVAFVVGWHSFALLFVLQVFDQFFTKEISRREGLK
jgi:hypothetical protein